MKPELSKLYVDHYGRLMLGEPGKVYSEITGGKIKVKFDHKVGDLEYGLQWLSYGLKARGYLPSCHINFKDEVTYIPMKELERKQKK